MKLPNYLTLSRLVMAAILLALLEIPIPFGKSMALLVFAVAGITDYFDGYLARTKYGETSFGRLMDPLADKVLVCAVFISFVGIRISGHSLMPAWLVVVIISREFLVTGLRLLAVGKGKVISAGRWGKHKTIWQIIAIVVLLLGLALREDIFKGVDPKFMANYDFAFGYIALGVSVAVALITVASGSMYFIQHSDLIREHI